MADFPQEDIVQDLRGLDLVNHSAYLQKYLRISWNIRNDVFTLWVSGLDTPETKRGVLSAVRSLYDPLGLAAPVTIQGKLLLRKITDSSHEWDFLKTSLLDGGPGKL